MIVWRPGQNEAQRSVGHAQGGIVIRTDIDRAAGVPGRYLSTTPRPLVVPDDFLGAMAVVPAMMELLPAYDRPEGSLGLSDQVAGRIRTFRDRLRRQGTGN
jgi:hypothetical protein